MLTAHDPDLMFGVYNCPHPPKIQSEFLRMVHWWQGPHAFVGCRILHPRDPTIPPSLALPP